MLARLKIGAAGLFAVALLVGCGSSTTTTSAPTTTHTSVAAATTTTAEPPPKQLAAQRARERKNAADKRVEEARENRLAAEARKEEQAKDAEEAATSNAKKVVEVWKQEPVEAGDTSVESISRHLLSLSHKCSQDIPTLAAYVNSGVEILAKEGIKESPVEIAAGLDKAAPGKKVAPDCRGILAALLVVMEKG